MSIKYWLMKTEPDVLSINDLKNRPSKKEYWDGVRNYQARNFMRDDMSKGDLVLIYHSSCEHIGVAGIAKVSKEAIPDPTSWDRSSKYFDPKSTKENPRWFMVEVQYVKAFKNIVTLAQIKSESSLGGMKLVQKGSRLSIMPVTKEEFEFIRLLGASISHEQ